MEPLLRTDIPIPKVTLTTSDEDMEEVLEVLEETHKLVTNAFEDTRKDLQEGNCQTF